MTDGKMQAAHDVEPSDDLILAAIAAGMREKRNEDHADTILGWVQFAIGAGLEARRAIDEPIGSPLKVYELMLAKASESLEDALEYVGNPEDEDSPLYKLSEFVDGIHRQSVKLASWSVSAGAAEAATAAFLECLPPLTTRRRVQAFIACAAAGQQYSFLSGEQARALLYTAQLALSAHRTHKKGKP